MIKLLLEFVECRYYVNVYIGDISSSTPEEMMK
jgi:hypothetical protein